MNHDGAPPLPPRTSSGPARSGSLFESRSPRGPVTLLLDLFSSVKFGIVLLTILFVYSSIGSAGILFPTTSPNPHFTFLGIPLRHEMVRQWRGIELTEFEWFHTTFFNVNIALICLNIAVTTVRRIRFNLVNLGVWTIHVGILILSLGSVIYFAAKVEGDSPVIRRAVSISVPGAPPGVMAALPGASTGVTTPAGDYTFAIESIDPEWELRSGADIGKKTMAVSVSVRSPKGEFVRQLLAGYPEYTEDVIRGEGRVKKLERFGGAALVDADIQMSLEPMAQQWFWLKDSAALCVRAAGDDQWQQRPIKGLPRYNDYISAPGQDVWPVPPDRHGEALRADPLNIPVRAPKGQADALAGMDVRVTGFLRYAVMQPGFEDGGTSLNPMLEAVATAPGQPARAFQLVALNPNRAVSRDGRLRFDWATSEEQIAELTAPSPSRLTFRVAGTDVEESVMFTAADLDTKTEMRPLGDTGWKFRVREMVERLPLQTGDTITLVIVDLTSPEGNAITRWVFEDPVRTRDNPVTAPEQKAQVVQPDPRLVTELELGHQPAEVHFIAGPGDIGVRLFATGPSGERIDMRPTPLEPVAIAGGRTVALRRFVQNAVEIQKPQIIPWQQRDRDVDASQSLQLVRVEVSGGGRTESRWIPFHRYSIDDPNEAPRVLTRYEPATFTLADGRQVELIVARERRPLPTPVKLDDFVLTPHVGGFTGDSLSIRDWTSVVRFKDPDGTWTEPTSVKTNDPASHARMWYFQAFWDAPRAPTEGAPNSGSPGMAFTGLGVGNREGVVTQLVGCCISVAGMIYAFYVKPIIKRRRREQVLAGLAQGRYARDDVDASDSTASASTASAVAAQEHRS